MEIPVRLQMEILSRVKPSEQKTSEPKAKEVKSKNEWESRIEDICKEIPSDFLQIEILKVLKTIIVNILDYPRDKKYRIIKLSNMKIKGTIGSCNAAIEFLIKVMLMYKI